MPKFHCIHCGQHIDAPNEMEGTKASCPTCGGDIAVPKNPSMPNKTIQHQNNVGATEKKSGIGSLIGSIIFIAVVGAFASVVGKSCGRSLANEHIKDHKTTQALAHHCNGFARLMLSLTNSLETKNVQAYQYGADTGVNIL